MKVIHTDNIISVTASEAETNFPVSHVSTDFRTQLWKGTTSINPVSWETGVSWESGVLWDASGIGVLPYFTLSVSGVASGKTMALAIINTSAQTVYITVTNFGGTKIVDRVAYNTEGDSDIVDLWVDYTAQLLTHTIKLEFLPPASDVADCGVVCIGESLEFKDPEYGLTEKLIDTSIVRRFNNGALHYEKRNFLRSFSGSINVQRDDEFYDFLHTIIKTNGQIPLAWLIVDSLVDRRWTVFGRAGMPSGSHAHWDFSQINFKIEESL